MLTVLDDHAVAQDALAVMRERRTSPAMFRLQMHRLSLIMASVVTRDLATTTAECETPLATCNVQKLSGGTVCVPIMRAGHGMLEAFQTFLPNAMVWHLSMSRMHEAPFNPIVTDSKVPDQVPAQTKTCFVLDPMLATAGSACFAIAHLKDRGAEQIVFVGVLGCFQGVERLRSEHPDVRIFLGGLDLELNEKAYIIPGLGDAGDRLYPTHREQ
jgi:uracil phosphoribosyltransferase